ncbi:MAG: hypothetical protein JWR58_1280 [Pseudonocardia sp.]|jgi:hypothetical protein|nr:hypothetical protein [Pseudonocardia sp.]
MSTRGRRSVPRLSALPRRLLSLHAAVALQGFML